jgi:hypothetical protein
LKRNAADGLFTKPSTLVVQKIRRNNLNQLSKSQKIETVWPKKGKRIKDENIRNLFATEVTEATEGFTFKNQKVKANGCGTCFEGAGSNSFPFSASISLCSLCPLCLCGDKRRPNKNPDKGPFIGADPANPFKI